MRSLCNNLGDPSLHLLAIALIVVYLAFGRGSRSGDDRAEAPLPTCKRCLGHYLPGTTCDCRHPGGMANAAP
jgi:hypothetical protein